MTTTCHYCLEQLDPTTARSLGDDALVCERCVDLLDAYLFDTPLPLDLETRSAMASLASAMLFVVALSGILAFAMLILPRLG